MSGYQTVLVGTDGSESSFRAVEPTRITKNRVLERAACDVRRVHTTGRAKR